MQHPNPVAPNVVPDNGLRDNRLPAGSDGTAVFRSKLVPVGRAAPAFSLKQLGGGRVSLAALRGTVVLLSFWTPSCPPCHVEAPQLQRLHQIYAEQGVRVLGIAPLTPLAEIHAFVKQRGITYSILVDPGEKVIKSYGLAGYPVTVLIDGRGVVRFTHAGFRPGDEKTLEQEIRALLRGRTQSGRRQKG